MSRPSAAMAADDARFAPARLFDTPRRGDPDEPPRRTASPDRALRAVGAGWRAVGAGLAPARLSTTRRSVETETNLRPATASPDRALWRAVGAGLAPARLSTTRRSVETETSLRRATAFPDRVLRAARRARRQRQWRCGGVYRSRTCSLFERGGRPQGPPLRNGGGRHSLLTRSICRRSTGAARV